MASTENRIWIEKLVIFTLFVCGLYMAYLVRSTIFLIIISGFLTILINPLADSWEKKHIPIWVTVIFVYIIMLILFFIVVGTVVPIIVTYITDIINLVISWANNAQNIYTTQGIAGFHLNKYVEEVIIYLFGQDNIDNTFTVIKQNAGEIQSFITTQLSSLTSGGISFVTSIGSTLVDFGMIAIMTLMMVIERREIGKFILQIMPSHLSSYLRSHYEQIQRVCTAWIRATLILGLSISVMTYVGLRIVETVFGFDTGRTFTLAVIGGIMEFIPYLGPILSFVPAFIIGLGISWKVAGIIAVLYIIIQQTEWNFLAPYIMSKNLELSQFFVFIVMLVGGTLGGILGIILALPIAGICNIIYTEYLKKKKGNPATDTEHVEVAPESESIRARLRRRLAKK